MVTIEVVTYARHNENAMVSAVEDVDALAEFTLKLLKDEPLAEKIATEALLAAKKYSLERTSALFEEVLLSVHCQ